MHTPGKFVWFLMIGCLGSLGLLPAQSWGQENNIGTVLAVEGTAKVRAQRASTEEDLKFRDKILLGDTVRTGASSKVKVLLRDESIMTLGENSEMEFSEFLLDEQQNQRKTTVGLARGALRVLTSRLFGAGSSTEVRTPNTIAGVRGTIFAVIFTPPDRTEVLTFDGVVTARNLDPAIPNIEPIPANFRSSVIGAAPPTQPREFSPAEGQRLQQMLRIAAQIPSVVNPTRVQQAAAQQTTTTARSEAAERTVAALVLPGVTSGTAVLPATAAAGPELTGGTIVQEPPATITPDTSPGGRDIIERSLVDVNIIFPR